MKEATREIVERELRAVEQQGGGVVQKVWISERYRGEVVNFSDALGYGFIRPNDGSRDLYVNWRNCPVADSQTGRRYLQLGQTVTFEIGRGPTGKQAVNVEVVD